MAHTLCSDEHAYAHLNVALLCNYAGFRHASRVQGTLRSMLAIVHDRHRSLIVCIESERRIELQIRMSKVSATSTFTKWQQVLTSVL